MPEIDTVVLDAPATGHGIFLLTAPRLFAEAIAEGPFARLAREVADFVADRQACGLVVVTHAEEMPVQEALELHQALVEKFGREPELLLVNGLYPALPTVAGQGSMHELWQQRRELNLRQLERLEQSWHGPRIELPLLPIDDGVELVAALTEHFEVELEPLSRSHVHPGPGIVIPPSGERR